MKFTIEGFSQKRAVELGLSVEDLVILRWFVDFFPSEKMTKMVHDGKTYALVSYSGFIEQMPIISCNKRTIARKFQRLVEANVLENVTIKQGGSFSVYRFGTEYESLIKNDTVVQKCAEGMYKTVQPPMYKNVHTNTNLYNSTNLINTNLIPLNPPMGDSPENEQKKESTSKKKKKVDFDSIFREYTQDDEVVKRLHEWLENRKAKRSANTESAIRKNLQKLSSLAKQSNMTVVEYLDNVIMRGWAAFFEISESKWKQQSNNNTKQSGTKIPDDSAYDIDHFFE